MSSMPTWNLQSRIKSGSLGDNGAHPEAFPMYDGHGYKGLGTAHYLSVACGRTYEDEARTELIY